MMFFSNYPGCFFTFYYTVLNFWLFLYFFNSPINQNQNKSLSILFFFVFRCKFLSKTLYSSRTFGALYFMYQHLTKLCNTFLIIIKNRIYFLLTLKFTLIKVNVVIATTDVLVINTIFSILLKISQKLWNFQNLR